MTDTEGDATIALRTGVAVGELFAGRYEVEELVGRGGMGSVYRVRDREVGEIVALKLLAADAATTESIDRFRREVRLARRVTHRNAARTYDLGEHEGWRFLTMEYVDGESLRAHLARARPSASRAVDFARQIAEGLAAAHEAGVVHRDLKPANVLLERSGRVVITDFGIARALRSGDATLQTGRILGTPAYMAPEQIAGTGVGPAADIYSLGLMLYEMLTGELPFVADSVMATALARLHQTLPDLRTKDTIPVGMVELLYGCLEREPDERLTQADELARGLAELSQRLGPDLGTLGMPTARAGAVTRTTGRPSTGTPTPPSGRALAVLPFRFRGPSSDAYIAETLSDELIDVLSTMRGLRVSGSGATARFVDSSDRDPRTLGSQLGVDVIVDGTVQLAGERVRISARLLDVQSGFQLWSDRYEGALADVFDLQDKMGRRIAEALRLELEQLTHRGEAPAEAIELYMRARQLARIWQYKGPSGSAAVYERCLALAPGFKPALAGYAIATLRAWFSPDDIDERDWEQVANVAVRAAIDGAPELAETHLAAGMQAVQHGEYRRAAESLRHALRIAPTYAAAHDYIGRLQLEAGRPSQGIAHLELAFDLDPALIWMAADIARHLALHGDYAGCEAQLARLTPAHGQHAVVPTTMLEMRIGAWRRDLDRVRRARNKMKVAAPDMSSPLFFADTLLDPAPDPQQMRERLLATLGAARNPRFYALVAQFGAESAAFHGFDELALEMLGLAARSVLVDLDWLENCPLLASLRSRPEYPELHLLVRRRAEAIWTAPEVARQLRRGD